MCVYWSSPALRAFSAEIFFCVITNHGLFVVGSEFFFFPFFPLCDCAGPPSSSSTLDGPVLGDGGGNVVVEGDDHLDILEHSEGLTNVSGAGSSHCQLVDNPADDYGTPNYNDSS